MGGDPARGMDPAVSGPGEGRMGLAVAGDSAGLRGGAVAAPTQGDGLPRSAFHRRGAQAGQMAQRAAASVRHAMALGAEQLGGRAHVQRVESGVGAVVLGHPRGGAQDVALGAVGGGAEAAGRGPGGGGLAAVAAHIAAGQGRRVEGRRPRIAVVGAQEGHETRSDSQAVLARAGIGVVVVGLAAGIGTLMAGGAGPCHAGEGVVFPMRPRHVREGGARGQLPVAGRTGRHGQRGTRLVTCRAEGCRGHRRGAGHGVTAPAAAIETRLGDAGMPAAEEGNQMGGLSGPMAEGVVGAAGGGARRSRRGRVPDRIRGCTGVVALGTDGGIHRVGGGVV